MPSSNVPTWFSAASNDRFPPNDLIVLGSITTNPKQLENSLNSPGHLITNPKEVLVKTLPEINHSSEAERNRDHTAVAQLKTADFVHSELSHGWSNKRTRGIVAARITSENSRRDKKHVADSVSKGRVAAHHKREAEHFKKTAPPLFIITGVKIAHEATLSRSGKVSTSSIVTANADVGGFQVVVGPFGS